MVSRNKYSFVLVLLISLLFTGCFGGSWRNTGLLTVEVGDGGPTALTKELVFSNELGLTLIIPLSGPSHASVCLPKGKWYAWAFARDFEGRVISVSSEFVVKGGRTEHLYVPLDRKLNQPAQPRVANLKWDWARDGAHLSWEIDSRGQDPTGIWQVYRLRHDGSLWEKIGAVGYFQQKFQDDRGTLGDMYGVRYVDSDPTYYPGPFVIGSAPIAGGIEISWEFEHFPPPINQRSLGLAMLSESPPEPIFTDLLVHFTSQSAFANRHSLLNAVGLEIKDEIPILSVVVVEPSWNSELSLEEWSTYSGPDFFIEPNWVVQADSLATTQYLTAPNHLNYIRVLRAQRITRGSPSIKVAVLDTGVRETSLPGVLFVSGYNFVDNNYDTNDDNYNVLHGTKVASLVSAVAPSVSIQPIKVLNGNGGGDVHHVIQGLLYAAGISISENIRNTEPANIINMSLGQIPPSEALEKAVKEVTKRSEAILIAASGNDGKGELRYPAGYPDVISVGGVVSSGYPLRASYSNYGLGLDLVAPVPDWREVGTSFSAPLVSGVAGLMLSNGIPPHQIKAVLIDTAMDLGVPGWDEQYGYGLVNAEWAVQQISSFELMVSDYWTKELVWHKEVPLKGNPIFVSLPPGEYMVEGRLNDFYGESQVVQVQGEYGEMVHLILRESIN